MTRIITLFLVFGLPFVVYPLSPSFFETPKILAGQFLIEILLIVSLFKLKLNELKQFRLTTFHILLISIFFFSILNFFTYPTPEAFFGNQFRRQGMFLLWHLLAFAFLTSLLPMKEEIHIKNLSFPQLSLILVTISSFLFGTSPDGRAVGPFGEPNSLGIYAAFLWPLTGKYVFAIPAFVVILLSGSRSALIALGVQLLFLLLTTKLHFKPIKATAACLLIIVFCLFLPFLETQAEYQNRPLIWKTAFSAALQKPIIGWGFGNTGLALERSAYTLENSLRFEYVDSTHNLLLEWFLEGGIVGMILLILLITLTLKALLQSNKNSYITSFLSLLTGLMFNPVSVALLLPFWWIIGQSANKKV